MISILEYVWSVLGTTRCIQKHESQMLANALRANYPRMFSTMNRKYHLLKKSDKFAIYF
jgi:hypothetical protein